MVAVSARMLAELAAADGYQVTALDRFGDVDLRAVAPGATAPSSDALAALAAGVDADAVVYGAGFENRPDLVSRLAEGRELLGTPPALLPAVRDPWAVGAAARAAGARAPETRPAAEPPGATGRGAWLRKPLQSGGGRGVRRWAGGRLAPTEILQRRVDGLSCSAVAIADGRRAAVLGLTEQLHRRPGFGWMGNVTPPRLPDAELAELDGQLRAVCDEVAARFGVRGSLRRGRRLGRAPRLGARGQPAGRRPRSSCSGPGASRHTSAVRGASAFRAPAHSRRRGVRR